MPRPAKDDPRDINLTIRLSSAEITELHRRADAEGCTLAAYARRAIFGRAADYATAPMPAVLDPATERLTEQVRRVGVNVNQMTRRCNELGVPPPPELIELLTEIRTYVQQAQQRA